jgi:YbbR domain-containing protein
MTHHEKVREKGFGNLKAILSLAVLAVIIFLTYKILPAYINNYQLQDQINTIAQYSSYAQNKTADDIRKDVLDKAKDCSVMLLPEQVAVEKSGTTVSINVKYTVHVDLPGKALDLEFNPTAGNKIITAR